MMFFLPRNNGLLWCFYTFPGFINVHCMENSSLDNLQNNFYILIYIYRKSQVWKDMRVNKRQKFTFWLNYSIK